MAFFELKYNGHYSIKFIYKNILFVSGVNENFWIPKNSREGSQ